LRTYEFNYVPLGGSVFPIVPVELRSSGSSWFATHALLDSGATLSLFDGTIAQTLGIVIREGRRIQPTGIAGSLTAYVHRAMVKIGEEEFEADVAFTYRSRPPLNLLGRQGVFEQFRVTFDERNKKTVLETI
jgi:predicted aspartyl protease